MYILILKKGYLLCSCWGNLVMQIKPCTQCFLSYITISPLISFLLRIQATCISAAVTDNASPKRWTSSGSLSILLIGKQFSSWMYFGGERQSQCHEGLPVDISVNLLTWRCYCSKCFIRTELLFTTVKIKAKGVAESRTTDIWSSQEAACAYKAHTEHQWEAVSTKRASKNETQRVGGSPTAATVVCPAQFWTEMEKLT